jgi:hypothetical protein
MRKTSKGIELLEGDVKGTAARAIVATVAGMLPNIRFTFTTRDTEWVVEMTLEDASKFLQQGLDAYQASVPRSPRPARNYFGDQ